MSNISYEIRTKRGKAIFIYDNLENAKSERKQSEKRIGIPLDIYEITRIERCLDGV